MLERILILGAHSVGKTTLTHRLLEELEQSPDDERKWVLVEEVARKVMQRDRWTREDVPKAAFQQAILDAQLEAESRSSVPYIADRCLLDPIAYTSLHTSSPTTYRQMLAIPSLQPLLASYRDAEKTLVIHLLPVEQFAHDDGVRSLTGSMEEWKEVSRAFASVLAEAGLKCRTLGPEKVSLKERVKAVREWMADMEAERQ
ncbi:hypothetical protein JCM6882_000478 [Rhodosporidiobolus microsporus]